MTIPYDFLNDFLMSDDIIYYKKSSHMRAWGLAPSLECIKKKFFKKSDKGA